MGLVQGATKFTSLPEDQVTRYLEIFADSVLDQVNGNLEFVKNIKATSIDVTFSTANENVGFAHALGRVPVGYIVIGRNSAFNIYDGSTPNTNSTIFLRASAVGSGKILVF